MKKPHALVLGMSVALSLSAGWTARAATVGIGRTNSFAPDLSSPTTITGIVRGPDGRPAAKVAVQIVGSFNSVRGSAPETDANGKFELRFDRRQFGRSDVTYCLLARDPEHNLAVAQELDEATGPLDLRLAPAMTVAGRAECEGKPITNATAALVFWTGNSGMHLRGMAVGTNMPGRFEIPALPLGRKYGVYVSAPGYGQKYAIATSGENEPKRIELDPVGLKPANLKLAGQVLDADDKPVSGASVNLNGEGQPSESTRTDQDGRFRFERVCEGMVRLFASATGMQGNVSAQGGDTNAVIRLGKTSAFFPGNGTLRKLKGIVTDPEGKPVSGAQVAVFPSPSIRGKTGDDGAYSLSWVMQSWQAQSGGRASLVVRDFTRDLAAAENLSENTTNLDVQLQPALRVTGHIKETSGSPLSDATIGTWLSAARIYSDINEVPARTDAQGNFEIKTLPPGPKYIVYATAKDHARHQQEVATGFQTNQVELHPFVLALADKPLAGQVVDDKEQPLSGVHVSLSFFPGEDQATGSATTDSKGRFKFKVCEGRARLFANGSAGVTAKAGDTNVVIQLSRNRTAVVNRASPTRSLQDLTAFGLGSDAAPMGKPALLCLFDAEQPPSRRAARRLAGQSEALRQKGIAVLGIQAAIIPSNTWQAWTNANPLPFPLGRAIEKSIGTRWATSVASLPWFILRTASGTVAAEGFALDELDAKIKTLK